LICKNSSFFLKKKRKTIRFLQHSFHFISDPLHLITGIAQFLNTLPKRPVITPLQKTNVVCQEKKKRKKKKEKRKITNKCRNKLPIWSMFKWRTMFNKIEWKLLLWMCSLGFWNSMWDWLNFLSLFSLFISFFFWCIWKKKLGVNCDDILNETNSKWNETIANSEIINGICLEGYDGSVSRSCVLINSIGNWSSISGSCQGYFFFLSFFLSKF